jgi:hypothetical protein
MSTEINITYQLLERLKKRYLDCEYDFFKHQKKIMEMKVNGIGINDANLKIALNGELADLENKITNLDQGTELGIPWVSKEEIVLYKTEIKQLRVILTKWNFEKFAAIVREEHEKMLLKKFKNYPFIPAIFEGEFTELHSAFKIEGDKSYDESYDSSDLDSFSNNEHYNDQLDMDQQDPEFWDNL